MSFADGGTAVFYSMRRAAVKRWHAIYCIITTLQSITSSYASLVARGLRLCQRTDNTHSITPKHYQVGNNIMNDPYCAVHNRADSSLPVCCLSTARVGGMVPHTPTAATRENAV